VSAAAVLAIAGVLALVVAGLLLRSVGSGLRLGRLLAGTRLVSIEDAIALARAGTPRYVRITGRISSEEEFPDDQDRPLVFRRTRLEVGQAGKDVWRTVLDEREAVPFAIETRSSHIAVDEAALAEGLVVIPRESVGVVSDLPADLAAGVPADAAPGDPARLTVEQLSAVEHAIVCGVPTQRDAGPQMTAGLGRPLIVTSLDQPAAMRLLARGKRDRVVVGAVILAVGLALLAAAVAALVVGF
jgi:hypothetical protein